MSYNYIRDRHSIQRTLGGPDARNPIERMPCVPTVVVIFERRWKTEQYTSTCRRKSNVAAYRTSSAQAGRRPTTTAPPSSLLQAGRCPRGRHEPVAPRALYCDHPDRLHPPIGRCRRKASSQRCNNLGLRLGRNTIGAPGMSRLLERARRRSSSDGAAVLHQAHPERL